MTDAFRIQYAGPHVATVESDNPKIDAYKQMAYLATCGIAYTLTCQDDGSYTVAGDGLEPITFEPCKSKSPN